MRRSPSLAVPAPPGCCTAWVASKQTGANSRICDQAAEVHHQVVVPEARAALGDEDPAARRRRRTFSTAWRMSRGRHELALLDVDRQPGGRAGGEQIRLPAQERGDLQAVDHPRGGLRLGGLVDVGEQGQPQLRLHAARGSAGPRRSRGPGTSPRWLRFALSTEALNTSGKPWRSARLRSTSARPEGGLLGLDHVEPGDQDERARIPQGDVAMRMGSLRPSGGR